MKLNEAIYRHLDFCVLIVASVFYNLIFWSSLLILSQPLDF